MFRFVKTPLKFITNVISMLDSEGLEYKENSLIKTNFLTTEVYENKKDLNNSKVRTSNGSEILIGQRGDGKFDGVAKVENVKWGKALLLYDKGIIDFSKTEFLDNKFFELVKKRKFSS